MGNGAVFQIVPQRFPEGRGIVTGIVGHPDAIDHLTLRLGQGITGWVAEHREPVAVGSSHSRIRGSRCSTSYRRMATRPYLAIQKQSRQRRRSKKEIAEAIIIGDDVRRARLGG